MNLSIFRLEQVSKVMKYLVTSITAFLKKITEIYQNVRWIFKELFISEQNARLVGYQEFTVPEMENKVLHRLPGRNTYRTSWLTSSVSKISQ